MNASRSTKYRKRKAEVDKILNEFSNKGKTSCSIINASVNSNDIQNIAEQSISTISSELTNTETEFDEFCQPDSDSESEQQEDCTSKSLEFSCKLARWGLDNNITHIAMKELVDILREEICGSKLPKDPRTLFKTPKFSKPVLLGSGKFKYFGVRNAFQLANRMGWENTCLTKSVSLGIDGLPISKSSKSQFWPILALFEKCRAPHPYVVALFFGSSKPSSLELFLKDLIAELRDITTNGIVISDSKYTLNVKCLIADAPARSFLKMCNGFNAYYGC